MKDLYVNINNIREAFIREPYEAEKDVPWETLSSHGWQVCIIMIGEPNGRLPIIIDKESKEECIELIEQLRLFKVR